MTDPVQPVAQTVETSTNLAVWPIGYDIVMMTTGTHEAAGTLLVLARPDGDFATPEEAWAYSAQHNGPGIMLVFRDEAAVDQFETLLRQVRQDIRDNPDRPLARKL